MREQELEKRAKIIKAWLKKEPRSALTLSVAKDLILGKIAGKRGLGAKLIRQMRAEGVEIA